MRKADLSSRRRATAETIPEHSGQWAVTPDPVPHTISHVGNEAIMALASEALDHLAQHLQGLPHRDQIITALDRCEAVASSQIEGTQTAVDELFYLEATGDINAVPADASATARYISSTQDAFQQVRQHGVRGFDEGMIVNIHTRLMEGTLHATGGYRTVQNWIGGLRIEEATYIPPRPARVPGLMTDLMSLLRYEPDTPMVTSIIMRLAIAHAQFEAIHPFSDGNGRVGRILMRLMLVAEEHCPLHLANVLKSRVQDYYHHLLQVQMRDDWSGWLGFLATAIYTACKQTEWLSGQLDELPGKWAAEHRLRRGSAAQRLLPLLISHPVLTARQAERLLGLTFKAANDGLERLVNEGILQVSDQARNRVFRANDVLHLLIIDLNTRVPFGAPNAGVA